MLVYRCIKKYQNFLKFILVFLFLSNMLYANSLKVAIISDVFNKKFNEQIIYESKKLFYEEQLTFSVSLVSKQEEFRKKYASLSKNKSIKTILILGEQNRNFLQNEKEIKKTTFLLNSQAILKKNSLSKKNLFVLDYSSYENDLKFIKENFPSDKLLVLKNLDNSLSKEEKDAFVLYDFVYISSLFLNKTKQLSEVLSFFKQNKIKSFYSGSDSIFTTKTLFFKNKINLTKISRTFALNLYQALKTKDELEKYTKIYLNEEINFNESIASKLFFNPSYDLLSKVKLNKADENKSNLITLQEALKIVLNKSFDYKIAKNELLLSNENINMAYSSYKPNISASLSYSKIDSDTARYSSGVYYEKTSLASLSYSQLLYSPLSYKNIDISKKLYSSYENETEGIKQRVLYEVVLAYLNTLSLQKSYEIVKSKKNFIKQNLFLAKNRLEVGFSDKSDIYRWQSELANVNIDLVNVKANLNKQKIEFTNLLQIPNDKEISLLSYDINGEIFQLFNKTPALLIKSPKNLKKLSSYLGSSFIKEHNAIKQYESLIKAKKEQIKATKQSFYLPTLSFALSASTVLDKDGEGSQSINSWDDDKYKATLNLKIPLYESGVKSINLQKYQLELKNLHNILNKIKLDINKDINKDMQNISSSYNSIKYSSIAYISAKKNYELIQDKYSKGKSTILELLDAQNSMIIARMTKNSSTYSYLLDISTIFYTIGYIDILHDKSQKEKIQNELKEVL